MRREVGGILFILIGIILVLFITTEKGKAVLAVLAGNTGSTGSTRSWSSSLPSDAGITDKTRGTIKS